MRQQRVGNDEWEITSMDLNFTGKILMLKSLKIQQHETGSDFRRVPGDLTLAQGIDMLKRVEAAFAESQATAGREARSAGSDQH